MQMDDMVQWGQEAAGMEPAAPQLLENYREDAEDMSKGEQQDMSQTKMKQAITVGMDEKGYPIKKWVYGYGMQDLIENAARVYNEMNPPASTKVVEVIRYVEQKPKDCCFKTYAERWLRLYKENTVRHTTLSEYRSVLNKHLLPELGDLMLSQITTDVIQEMLLNRKEYAKKTLHELIMVLGMILDGALEDGYIRFNPAKSARIRNPSTKKMMRKVLEEQELVEVIQGLPKLSQARDRRFLALLIYTGMRREEVLGLKWTDIDTENRLIHVDRAITFRGNKAIVGEPKTENGRRFIPMCKALFKWLTHDETNKEYVVQDQISQQIVKRMWQRISAEIEVFGTTPHCYRHMFTTLCRRSGMDEKTMQIIGGWSDIETMRNVYTHIQAKDVCKASGIIDAMFDPENLG